MVESSKKSKGVRLHKFIADSGITSRRKAEEMILDGLVAVNEEVVTTLGTTVDPDVDVVSVEGRVVEARHLEKIYILFHKPRGCVTTLSDPEGRETVMDYMGRIPQRIYPVGRLDYYSEGLLLLTNDGDVANRIMHPKHEVMKIYEVKVFGIVTDDILRKLRKGVLSPDGLLKPDMVRIIKQLPQKTWLEFRIHEGKNREIRRICEVVGLTIDKLKRISIANLTIDGLAPGKYRFLTKHELFSKLGWSLKDEDYQKNFPKDEEIYRDGKKSLKIAKRGDLRIERGKVRRADDEKYIRYRSQHYVETMKKQAELKDKLPPLEKKTVRRGAKVVKRGGGRKPANKTATTRGERGRR
ncbi:MAG: rRNA pseudouridine synthase [Oligoflexia bacterium]|nr:rRNA pseudouridine synthase [Oligoflexia bacterium]MBF0364387.1 rRNA pseudouridine synthase [Oligoflexia bacterium]